MEICENCGAEHDGTYGSGRFCSLKCSRSFSTKAKRKEINEKVSRKLSGIGSRGGPVNNMFYCQECGKKYFRHANKTSFCSIKCANISRGRKGGLAIKKDTSKMGGLRDGGGRSKVFEYVSRFEEKMKLNNDEIKIAKILDESNLKWKRNNKGFKYCDDRHFYPDFYLEDFNIYIEYKGWIVDHMRNKMKLAQEINKELNLIIVVSDRFRDDGITVSQFVDFVNKIHQNF